MKTYIWIIASGLVVAIASGCAPDVSEQTEATRTPASTITWADSDLGVQLFGAYGDSSKGPHITFVKFKPDQKTPVHTHTSAYTGVVLAGTGRHHLPGQPDTQTDLPVGSTWFMPANVEHISECLHESECVFAVYQQGMFDFHEVKQE